MKFRIAFLTAAALAVASAGFAQVRRGTFEFTPFYGYLFGGDFPAGSNDLFTDKVDVDDHYTYGASFGYYLTSAHEFEFRWAHTDTHFVNHSGGGLFGSSGSENLADLTINYYMADWSYNFGHSRAVPYFTMGAGAATLNPGQRTDVVCPGPTCIEPTSATRFTASFGGGLKVFATPNFGFRFDGRWYETYLGSGSSCDTFGHNHDCHDHGSNWLGNGEVSGGLILAF
jgi:outer membrane protein with beta-barrel domain